FKLFKLLNLIYSSRNFVLPTSLEKKALRNFPIQDRYQTYQSPIVHTWIVLKFGHSIKSRKIF
ncbi:hypothetical protein BpHYR1_019458, partial [Brachionus plicatilis]